MNAYHYWTLQSIALASYLIIRPVHSFLVSFLSFLFFKSKHVLDPNNSTHNSNRSNKRIFWGQNNLKYHPTCRRRSRAHVGWNIYDFGLVVQVISAHDKPLQRIKKPRGAFHSTKLLLWNFGNFTCSLNGTFPLHRPDPNHRAFAADSELRSKREKRRWKTHGGEIQNFFHENKKSKHKVLLDLFRKWFV